MTVNVAYYFLELNIKCLDSWTMNLIHICFNELFARFNVVANNMRGYTFLFTMKDECNTVMCNVYNSIVFKNPTVCIMTFIFYIIYS